MKRLLVVPIGVVFLLALASAAMAGHTPGTLNCPSLSPHNNNKYGITIGQTVTCTIVGATDATGTTIPVIIKSSDFGNQTVTGTVSGTTITFTYTAPTGGCNTVVVAYGSNGNNTNSPFGSGNAGGFALLSATGSDVTTCGGSPPPPPDTTSPTCKLTATVTGPPKQIQVTVEDTGSGIATIVPVASNATVTIGSYSSGDKTSILIVATKTNQSLGSTLKLTVTDVAGNVTVCDPVIPGQRVLSLVGLRAHALAGLPSGLTTLLVRNGGRAGSVVVRVNGHAVRIGHLAAHQTRRVDIARWMRSGRHNRIVVQQVGHNRHATVVIA